MFAMLTFVVRCYKKIIDVRVDEIEPTCDFVDESLTRLRGVPKPKHHVCCFEKTERRCYRGFFDVLGRNRNLIVSADENDLWEDSLTMQMMSEVFDMWRWVPVGYGAGVQRTVVATWSQVSVLFRHYVQRWCPRAFRWSHHALLDHELEFLLYLFNSIRCETAGFVVDRRARRGFDVVYHTVWGPLFSENRWAGEVRKFCQELVIWWFADNGLNGHFVCRGGVSRR